MAKNKYVDFVLSDALTGDILLEKVVRVPASATEDDLDAVGDVFLEDMVRFFDDDTLELAQVWMMEVTKTKHDYEATQEEDGEWDLRPLR